MWLGICDNLGLIPYILAEVNQESMLQRGFWVTGSKKDLQVHNLDDSMV